MAGRGAGFHSLDFLDHFVLFGGFLVYIKEYVARVLRVRIDAGAELPGCLALFNVPVLGHADFCIERHGYLVLEVSWNSWLGDLVWQGSELAIRLVHCVQVEAWRVVFYCWVFVRDKDIVLFALVPFVWNMESRLAAIWVVHLLLYNITKDILLPTALLPPHAFRDVIG